MPQRRMSCAGFIRAEGLSACRQQGLQTVLNTCRIISLGGIGAETPQDRHATPRNQRTFTKIFEKASASRFLSEIVLKSETKEYSIWLDAMRGIASLIVFLSHSRLVFFGSAAFAIGGFDIATQKAEQRVAQAEVAGLGHMAVIVFFVLSGYLVGGGAVRALRKNQWSASQYAIARISRLWTVLIPILAIGFLLDNYGYATAEAGSLYLGPSGQIAVPANLGSIIGFSTLLGNLFFVQGILVSPFGTNFPLWTLAYEFWFYVAFPFLLFLAWPSSTILTRFKCAPRTPADLCVRRERHYCLFLHLAAGGDRRTRSTAHSPETGDGCIVGMHSRGCPVGCCAPQDEAAGGPDRLYLGHRVHRVLLRRQA